MNHKHSFSCSRLMLALVLMVSSILSACGGSHGPSGPQAEASNELSTATTKRATAAALITPAGTWVKVANESARFTVSGTQLVRYGSGTQWIEKTVSGTGIPCTNAYFGRDPLVGTIKQCDVWTVAAPAPAPNPAPAGQVALNWAEPASSSAVSGTLTVRLTGQAFKNVEIFRNGQMIARATVSADMTTATASIDTRQFPDGAVSLTAHAWNSLAGVAFTSDADAGARNFTVNNTAPAPTPTPTPVSQVTLRWAAPATNSAVSGTVQLRLTGQAFKNVEVFNSGRMVARATVSADMTTATASINTTQFANGSVVLTAHAWNSAPGVSFTSDADAGALNLAVNNAAPTPTPTPGTFWNSGIDGLSRDHHNAFGAWRGKPSTSTWINLLWLPWDWLTAPGLSSTSDGQTPNVKVWDLYKNFPGIVVLSMSMAGNGNVDRAVYENNMRDCANGAYNNYWAAFGANATAAGRNGNNTVVSPAQEFNGTWFKWHPKNVGLDVWKRCWRNVYNSIKSTSTVKVAWVFSATTITSNAGADWAVNSVWDAWPADGTGKDYVDVIGVNRYDHPMHGYLITDWRAKCANKQDICFAANEARRLGKPLGINEWGPDRHVGNPDNAEFITMMYNFFKDNRDVLLYETHFATILGNDLPGDWHLFPQSSINIKASTRYKQLWSAPPP